MAILTPGIGIMIPGCTPRYIHQGHIIIIAFVGVHIGVGTCAGLHGRVTITDTIDPGIIMDVCIIIGMFMITIITIITIIMIIMVEIIRHTAITADAVLAAGAQHWLREA